MIFEEQTSTNCFMKRGDLFSPLECFISDAAKLIRREESGYSVSEIISKNGCIIHSFINEFVNIIIITEAEYYQFTKDKKVLEFYGREYIKLIPEGAFVEFFEQFID